MHADRLAYLVDATAAAKFRGGGVAVNDIVKLSRLFGEERSARRSDYMSDPRLRRAYLAFFLPQYAAKLALLIERHSREGLLTLPQQPRVLDVGAGPLTGIIGAWLASPSGTLGPSVAVDLASRSMSAGKALLDAVAPGQPVQLRTQPLAQLAQQARSPGGVHGAPFDLIVVAHVLNELGDPRRALATRVDLLRALSRLLAPGGRVVVVEPGTRVHGRALQVVRDALVDDADGAGDVAILSPCRGAPSCPLLKNPADWCHGEIAWQRPAAFASLEEAAGLRKDTLKLSQLLLARAGDASAPSTLTRIVGGLMTDREGVERRYGCARELVVFRGKPRLDEDVRRLLRHELLPREARVDETEPRVPLREGGVRPSRGHGARAGPRASAPRGRSGRGRGDRRRR